MAAPPHPGCGRSTAAARPAGGQASAGQGQGARVGHRLMRSRLLGYVAALALVCTRWLAAPSYADPLPTGTDVDYQLGGNRSVPDNVGIVVRDREAAPAAGRYNVCYVNGFQTQPNERPFWRRHWDLVLKHDGKAGRGRGLGRVAARHPHRRQATPAGPDRGRVGRRLRRRRLRRGRVRQPGLVHPQPPAAEAARAAARTPGCWCGRAHDAGPAGRPEEPRRLRRHDGSASTSRSPRSAGATTSATRTPITTATGCS